MGNVTLNACKPIALFLVLVAAQCPLPSQAQNDPNNPLVVFMQNTPGTAGWLDEVSFGVADICPNLGGFTQPAGPQRDLFLRCNEMIATACRFNDPTDPNCGRTLGMTDPQELVAAMQQLWGEELQSNSKLSTRLTNGQFSNIAGRMNALRLGGASGAVGGRVATLAPDTDTDRNSVALRRVALDSRNMHGGGAAGDVAGSRFGWFLEGSFNTGDHDQTSNEDAFDFDAITWSVGADYLFDAGVIGVAVGRDNFQADFSEALMVSGGGVEVEGTSASLFGAWFGERFYFDGLVTFGRMDNDMSRKLVYASTDSCIAPTPCPPQNRSLLGETEGDFLATGATFGYEIHRGNWGITTSLSVAYRDIGIDGFDETDSSGGGLGLRYNKQEIDSLRSILGIAFTGNFSRSFGVLSPQFRAEWHHEFEDDRVFLEAKYLVEDDLGTVPPGDFTGTACLSCVRWGSDEVDTDFGLVGVGLSAVFARRVQAYLMYDELIGVDNLSSHSIALGLRGQF